MAVKMTDNSAAVLAAAKIKKRQALEAIGQKWDRIVVSDVPVDTGNLRNSRGYNVGSDSVTVGFTADYAPYVELGTYKQSAQPYLKPSVLNHADDYKATAEKIYKG